jgi:hypothetical protein
MMLRGSAIALLPINFMVIALLSQHPDIPLKSWLVPLVAAMYVSVLGGRLRRWCAAVHPRFGWLQGGTLLGLNALVLLIPLATLVAGGSDRVVGQVLDVGSYLGFFGLGAAVWYFSQHVLNEEMTAQPRVLWFFVVTLALTFLEVFGLVHGFMKHRPQAINYAGMMVLVAGLVFLIERQFLARRLGAEGRQPEPYSEISFVGFAFVLLGLLMGINGPIVRIVAFLLAGVVWLYQASFRPGLLQYWIGLTLLAIGGASIGLLETFPKSEAANWLPALGLGLGIAIGLVRMVARQLDNERLAQAAHDFQPMVFLLTAIVSVLSQWQYRSEPLSVALTLVLIAAVFGWRAHQEQHLGWVHTAMALLALLLPYIGLMDVVGGRLHGNNLVFGLAVLAAGWIFYIRRRPTPLLLRARSTVLWSYGALAVAAMAFRVIIERGNPGDVIWYRATMDYAGPLLMTFVLALTTYYSRSLIPAAMAVVIVAILFPELKTDLQRVYPMLTWGSGLGSATFGLIITLACFPLKRWRRLRDLGEGDLFLGKTPFPLRRYDHTLFTWPLLAVALFLTTKVDTWTLIRHLSQDTMGMKTALALGLTGVTWTWLAVHLRSTLLGAVAVHLGWIGLYLGVHHGYRDLASQPQWQVPILLTGLVLQGAFFFYWFLKPRHDWIEPVLIEPTRWVLRLGSVALAAAAVGLLVQGEAIAIVQWLSAFLALQLGWHALSSGQRLYGATLFVLLLALILAWSAPGEGVLFSRLSFGHSFLPVLLLALSVQLFQLALEWKPEWYSKLRALIDPFQIGSTLLVGAVAVFLVFLASLPPTLSHQIILLATLILTARAHGSGGLALVAILLGYLFLRGLVLGEPQPEGPIFLLGLAGNALLSLALALLAYAGQWVEQRAPRVLAGPFPRLKSSIPALAWVLLPSSLLIYWMALLLTVVFLIDSDLGVQWRILLTFLVMLGLTRLYPAFVERAEFVQDWLLKRTPWVMQWWSLILGWGIVILLLGGSAIHEVNLVVAFLTLALIWYGFARSQHRYGTTLFVLTLVFLLAWSVPGRGNLWPRLGIENALLPVLLLALLAQVVQLGLEWKPALYPRLRSLLEPFQLGSSLLIVAAAIVGVTNMIYSPTISLTITHELLLLATLILAARAHRSGALALGAVLLGYLFVFTGPLRGMTLSMDRFLFLATPGRVALLALIMAALGHAGQLIHHRVPKLLAGPFRLFDTSGTTILSMSARVWLFLPSALLACLAAVYHTVDPGLRQDAVQLLAPYLGAITLALIAWSWRRAPLLYVGGVLLSLANVHAVNLTAGGMMGQKGLSDIHIIGLGLVFTLFQASALRVGFQWEALLRVIHQGSLFLAALVLVLLGLNYFAHPDLTQMTSARFILSGFLALVASQYFRQAARQPGPGEARYVAYYDGVYHYGLAVSLWCFALLVPWLRSPETALIALGVPLVYFYLRAEFGRRRYSSLQEDPETDQPVEAIGQIAGRYRRSAEVLGFLLLVLYAYKGIFQMIAFPGTPILTEHYHNNALAVIALSLVLFRLHGLGGTWWLALYGGLALMTGTYFAVTSFPRLSPFDHPIPAAWMALAVTHFFIAASAPRSPLGSWIRKIGHIEPEAWINLRQYWGYCLLGASQVVIFLGLLNYQSNSYQVALLLVAAASIFIHLGLVSQVRWYFQAAVVELVFALHADFMLPSYLPRQHVVWVLLILWAGLAALPPVNRWLTPKLMVDPILLLFLGSGAHIFFQHPSASGVGLSVVALMAVLGAMTPTETRKPVTSTSYLAAGLPLLAVPWLAYFSQVRLSEEGMTWPILLLTAALLATGIFARLYQKKWASFGHVLEEHQPRLYHRTLSVLEQFGDRIHTALLWLTFLISVTVTVSHYPTAFSVRELVCLTLVWAGLTVGWFGEGRDRHALHANVIAELCLLGLLVVIRRQLMLTTTVWTYQYDVWASLIVSAGLAGAKDFVDEQSRELRLSLLATLWLMPAVSVGWILAHGLGTDITLLAIGLQSLCFAFMGKDRPPSAYNVAAIAGFVSFVLLLFWSKLELRVLHAYTVPVGIGLLMLLQIFGRQLHRETRNGIRLVTLLVMLGSAGYYAIADYPWVFHVHFLLLCLAAMGLGDFLKVRLYLILGFAGAMIDVAAIIYKAVVQMERTYRLALLGLLLLLLGTGLVAGTAFYKTHRAQIEERLRRWRALFGEWE